MAWPPPKLAARAPAGPGRPRARRGRRGLFIWAAFLALFLAAGPALAGEKLFRAGSVTVRYEKPEQLAALAEKIRPGAGQAKIHQILVPKSGAGQPETGLAINLDRLFRRVQLLLDMPMDNLSLNIRLFSSKLEVQQAYRRAVGNRPPPYQASHPLAFYSKKTNTIYLQTEQLNIGIVAHEMGHAILQSFHLVPPPLKIQEMICQFVDRAISAGH